VAALLAELGYPDNREDHVRRRLAMWEHEASSFAPVAEHDGRMSGVIAVTAIPYLEHEGRWGRIVALVVSAACRGQGIGRQLVGAAEKAAGELGCIAMEVTSARSCAESHPFYQSLGYEQGRTAARATSRTLFPAPERSPGASLARSRGRTDVRADQRHSRRRFADTVSRAARRGTAGRAFGPVGAGPIDYAHRRAMLSD